jgi:apolipoprotein N-acyltransferase
VRRVLTLWGLALSTPALLGIYASAPGLVVVPYVALVPWVLLYTDDRRPDVSIGYFVPAAWVAWLLLHPQSVLFGWQFPFVAATTFALPWLPFAPLLRRLHRRLHLPRVVSLPVVWVAVEWMRALLSLSHFDVFRLGYTQASLTPLIQLADVTGVYGVSFLVAAVNGVVADLYFALRDAGWRARAWAGPRNLVALGSVALAFGAAWIYGSLRLAAATYEPGPRVAIVQPNIRHRGGNVAGVHLAQVLMTEERVAPGAADLVIWPENAILGQLRRQDTYLEFLDDLGRLARKKSAWLLVGSMGKPPSQPGRTTNGAFLVDTEGRVVGQYDKQLLFPWSEYVPLDGWLSRVAPAVQRLQRTLVRRGWGFVPAGVRGADLALLGLAWQGRDVPFGTLICFENTYPPLAARAARLGARFLVNITSEGEIGGSMQVHLLRTSMLRAVENRLAYVRVGNTGISGIIDPAGRVRRILVGDRGRAISDSGVLIDSVPLGGSGPTLYARSRDAFAKACLVLCLGSWAWTWIPRARPALGALGLGAVAVVAGCAGPPALGDDGSKAAERLAEGQRLLAAGRPGPALRALAEACAEPGSCGQALPLLEQAFLGAKAPEAGVLLFTTILERYPQLRGRALGHRGYLLRQSLEFEGAERDYRMSLAVEANARVSARLGRLLLRLEDREGAIDVLREGLRHDPDDLGLRYNLSRALRLAGETEEAERLAQSVLRDDPRHAGAWTNLGSVYTARGQAAAARTAFLQAAAVGPGQVESRYHLAKLALDGNDLAEAKRWLQEIHAIEARFLGRGPREEDP